MTDMEHLFGPLLEIRQGRLHFVHFSAKEFLETKESKIELDRLVSHYSMALKNITYLSFDCFSPALSEQEIINHVLNGDYLWVHYARRNWLEHASLGSRVNSLDTQDLYDGLNRLFDPLGYSKDESRETLMDGTSMMEAQGAAMLEDFPKASYDLKLRLGYTIFYESQLRGIKPKDIPQPLSIDTLLSRVWETVEAIIINPSCSIEQHDSLRALYGLNLFFCRDHTCPKNTIGFRSQTERDEHSHIHDVLFKCKVATCEYSHQGFSTDLELQEHAKTHEMESIVRNLRNLKLIENSSTEDNTHEIAWKMTQDAIHESNIPRLEHLLQNSDRDLKSYLIDVLHEAAQQGSLAVIRHILDNKGIQVDAGQVGHKNVSPLCVAGTVETVQLLLDYGANPRHAMKFSSMRKDIGSAFSYIVGRAPFEEHMVATIMDHELNLRELLELEYTGDGDTPFEQAARTGNAARLLSMVKERGVSLSENMAQRLISSDKSCIETDLLPQLLQCGAEFSGSVLVKAATAKDLKRMESVLTHVDVEKSDMDSALLAACEKQFEEGVSLLLSHNVDPNGIGNDEELALVIAGKRRSAPAARIVKMLIEAGADPSRHKPRLQQKKFQDFQVVKHLKEHIGVTLEELLGTRRKSTQAGEAKKLDYSKEAIPSSVPNLPTSSTMYPSYIHGTTNHMDRARDAVETGQSADLQCEPCIDAGHACIVGTNSQACAYCLATKLTGCNKTSRKLNFMRAKYASLTGKTVAELDAEVLGSGAVRAEEPKKERPKAKKSKSKKRRRA